MRSIRGQVIAKPFLGAAGVLLIVLSTLSVQVQAQQLGNNAVYKGSATCCAGSPAFIDASAFSQVQFDICATLYNIISPLSYVLAGTVVVDARGINATNAAHDASGNLKCVGTPWQQGSSSTNNPANILLPANTILISQTWFLPDASKIIGEGAGGVGADGSGTVTTLRACNEQGCTAFPTNTAMVQMGNSSCAGSPAICHSVGIEDISLDGQAITGVGGIVNNNSQELSYVKHVSFYQILGTGLSISGNANNSGPYSEISYDTGVSGVFASTCVNINGVNGIRGIHGLTCMSSPDAQTAVYLDSYNSSIEDVRIIGFLDGILIGSRAEAHSNLLKNILGDTKGNNLAPVNVVHISNHNPVTDLALMGVANAVLYTNTILDDLTSTPLNATNSVNSYVGMYAIGKSVSIGGGNLGYSRYTTSPTAPTWAVGNPDNANVPGGSCAVGSLYSNTSANARPALYVCGSGNTWKPVR